MVTGYWSLGLDEVCLVQIGPRGGSGSGSGQRALLQPNYPASRRITSHHIVSH